MTKKILVVDDEEDLLELIQLTLEKTKKYTVLATSNPLEVEEICVREKPDLLLLDIVMPEMEGPDLVRILRNNPKTRDLRIILTSGGGEMVYRMDKESPEGRWSWEPTSDLVLNREEYIDEKSPKNAAKAYDVDDFLPKPFPPEFLLEAVEEVLNRDKKEDEED